MRRPLVLLLVLEGLLLLLAWGARLALQLGGPLWLLPVRSGAAWGAVACGLGALFGVAFSWAAMAFAGWEGRRAARALARYDSLQRSVEEAARGPVVGRRPGARRVPPSALLPLLLLPGLAPAASTPRDRDRDLRPPPRTQPAPAKPAPAPRQVRGWCGCQTSSATDKAARS